MRSAQQCGCRAAPSSSRFEIVIRAKGYLRASTISQHRAEDQQRHAGLMRDIARVELGPDERRGSY